MHLMRATLIAALLTGPQSALAIQPKVTQEAPVSQAQDWWGEVALPGDRTLAFSVSFQDDGSATLSVPAQRLLDRPLHDVIQNDNTLAFTLRVGPNSQSWARFQVEILDSGAIGTMSQTGAVLNVRMTRGTLGEGELPDPAAIAIAQNAQYYAGATDFAGGSLPFVVTLRQQADGGWTGSLDIPVQSSFGSPLTDVEFTETEIRFTLRNPGPATNTAHWILTRDPNGTSASGICKQLGGEWPTTVDRADSHEQALQAAGYTGGPQRPQTPEPPFDYRVEEIDLEGADAQRIAGTLTLPDPAAHGEGPYPGVVLISGSGQQDRDSTIVGHRPFAVIAHHLTARGIAVLRYDDRGVGGSEGNPLTSDSSDYAEDAALVLDMLADDARIDNDRVGFIGHSEGGLIAPMAMTHTDHADFVVLLAGMALPGDDVIVGQGKTIALAAGADPDMVEQAGVVRREMTDAIIANADNETMLPILTRLIEIEAAGQLTEEDIALRAQQLLAVVTSPWYSNLVRTDPADYLKQISVPVLAMQGETDTQVIPEPNLNAITRALADGKNPPLTVRRYPGLNHLFQQSETGALSEYETIEETFNASALQDLGDWIVKLTGAE